MKNQTELTAEADPNQSSSGEIAQQKTVTAMEEAGKKQNSSLHEPIGALIAEGRYDEALVLQEQALNGDPTNSALLTSKADLLASLGRYREADSYYDKAIQREPDNILLLRNKALALAALGRVKEALKYCDHALHISPQDTSTLRVKGDLLLKKNYKAAIVCFEKAASLDSASFRAQDWTLRGDTLSRAQQSRPAIVFYNKAIKADPKHFRAWRGKALALNALDTPKKQILRCFTKALQIQPDSSDLWVEKGDIFIEQELPAKAFRCYEKAAEITPDHFDAWYGKGVALEKLGKFDESFKALNRAIKIDPHNTDVWIEKSYCQTNLNDFEGALQSSERALKLTPQSLWAWNNKGWALLKLGRPREALKAFDAAIKIDVGESLPRSNKGRCLQVMGRMASAKKCFEESVRMSRDRNAALTSLANFYSDHLYKHKEALAIFMEALKLNPNDTLTRANIAECLIKVGYLKQGRNWAIKAMRRLPSMWDQCAMQYMILISYALSGDRKKRSGEFKKFLQCFDELKAQKHADEPTWDFGGLANIIRNSKADAETKFLLMAGIDLQQGKLDRSSLTFFQNAIKKVHPNRDRKTQNADQPEPSGAPAK